MSLAGLRSAYRLLSSGGWLVWGFGIILCGLQWRLWMGDASILVAQRLRIRLLEEQGHIAQLEVQNASLKQVVQDVKNRLEALEERARSELGLVKDDERFYQYVP